MRRHASEQLTPPLAVHGEGPFWDEEDQRVLWVDMLAGRVIATDPADGRSIAYDVPDPVAALVRRTNDGRHVVLGEQSIWLGRLESEPVDWERIGGIDFGEGVRANEGMSTQTGELYVGSMAYDEHPGGGRVVRLSADGTRVVVLADVSVANGMHLESPTSVLFIDSPTRQVARYRIAEDGRWVEPATVLDLSGVEGIPDGMAVDAEGGIWVAMWDGGVVQRYAPSGELDRVVTVPVPRPTSCTLGGEHLTTLFITTSRLGTDPDSSTPAGSLFAIEVDVPGCLASPVITAATQWQIPTASAERA